MVVKKGAVCVGFGAQGPRSWSLMGLACAKGASEGHCFGCRKRKRLVDLPIFQSHHSVTQMRLWAIRSQADKKCRAAPCVHCLPGCC